MNCDSFRRNLTQFFQTAAVGTHSLRKGGAHWYKTACSLPEELVQAQGGWSAPETMRAFYARFSDSERCDQLLRAASTASSGMAVPAVTHRQARVSPMPLWRRLTGSL